jgi:hypothetical protein
MVCLAQEAMEFGLVDGILERRLTSDSKESSSEGQGGASAR